MLQFKSLESSYLVIVNEQSFSLTEAQIDVACYLTADLIDNNHEGSAPITLGHQTVVLEQSDWESLYDITEAHIQNCFEIDGMDDYVVH